VWWRPTSCNKKFPANMPEVTLSDYSMDLVLLTSGRPSPQLPALIFRHA